MKKESLYLRVIMAKELRGLARLSWFFEISFIVNNQVCPTKGTYSWSFIEGLPSNQIIISHRSTERGDKIIGDKGNLNCFINSAQFTAYATDVVWFWIVFALTYLQRNGHILLLQALHCLAFVIAFAYQYNQFKFWKYTIILWEHIF